MLDMKEFGNTCKRFRIEHLDLGLTEFSKLNNENLQNIHAFESGRANNIKYIFMYLNTGNDEQKEYLAKELFNIL